MPLNADELRAIIAASGELKSLADAGNDSGLAAALSAALPMVPKPNTFLGERGVYALLGIEAGETFLQTIEGLAAAEGPLKAVFTRVERWLKDSTGLDVGLLATQQTLLSLSAANGGQFANDSVAAIIAFGSQPQTVSVDEVSAALAADRIGAGE